MPPTSIPPLRIIALPLTRSKLNPTSTPLTYFHISQQPVKPSSKPITSTTSSSSILTSPAILKGLDYKKPTTWPDHALVKASEFWLSLSETQQEGPLYKTWQYKTWKNGERLMDKIPFEEWGLKNVNTSLDPWTGEKKVVESKTVEELEKEKLKVGGEEVVKKVVVGPPIPGQKIPLIYPTSTTISLTPSPESPTTLLKSHLLLKIPHHKSLFYRSLILIPILLPIGLLPVVPNLPMFYVMWRGWSHWKAWKGGEYLLDLVEGGYVEGQGDEKFGKVVEGVVEGSIGSSSGVISTSGVEEVKERSIDETSTPKGQLLRSSNPSTPTIHPSASASSSTSTLVDSNPEESKESAPDSTSTPSSLIYKPSSDTSKSSSTSSTPTFSKTEILLPPTALPQITTLFELHAPEIVDIRRAMDQGILRAKEVEGKEDGGK